MFFKLKILIILLTFSSTCYSVVLVPVAVKNIGYKEKIYSYNINFVPESKQYSCKKYIDMNLLKQNKYYSKSFIRKDRPICLRNVILLEDSVVRFKFGNLEIEKEGELIRETDQYIKIKNLDGTINKIYKDGRN